MLKIMESYFLLLIMAIILPVDGSKFYSFVLGLFVIFSVIPHLTIYGLSDQSRVWVYTIESFWVILSLWFRKSVFAFRVYKIYSTKEFNAILLLGGLICLEYSVFVLVITGSFNLFDLTKVYDVRMAYKNLQLPFVRYILNWTALVIIPLLVSYFLTKNRLFYCLLMLGMQFLLFSATGNKSYLMSIFFVLAARKIVEHKRSIVYLSNSLSAILIASILSFYLFDDEWLSYLLSNRPFILPAKISFEYYQFFSQEQLVFLSHSIFSSFVNYPYSLEPMYLLGQIFYNNERVAANTGMVADAYMNFGFLGVLLVLVLFFFVLTLIQVLISQKDMKIAIGAILLPIFFLFEAPFLTAFLTGGLGFAILILFLLPNRSIAK
ncbi:hypothetical protein AXX12_08290 [Anaerosporomusa subterranea]|uniref:Polymerase n=1 Tax=Anaerosporomusa subterranea TaxID=1794912 RepID=A0A154BQY0_ANASB|nr:hypothetical protein AXX12_08290 [Anaerosporomusa subterranea]